MSSDAYRSYAQALASWGYCVLLYDKVEAIGNTMDDVTAVKVQKGGRHNMQHSLEGSGSSAWSTCDCV